MEKIYGMIAICLLLVSALAVPMALAEDEVILADSEEVPEEPLLIAEAVEEEQIPSAFRYGWEKFKLNFVRNQTIRAERELQLARWKVAEARLETQKGNIERAEKAMQENERMMARVQERVEKMESLTPGLDQALRVHEERMNSLNLALDNANLTEQQRERIEARISKIENVSQVLEQNRERIQTRAQEILDEAENDSEAVGEVQEQMQQGKNN